MTLSDRLKKRLIHTGIIPLAVLLTGCPEKLPKDFPIENIQKIRHMECTMIEVPAEPYKIDAQKLMSDPHLSPGVKITFKAWYNFDTTKEPDYTYTCPKRKSNMEEAGEACDDYVKYVRKMQQQNNQNHQALELKAEIE